MTELAESPRLVMSLPSPGGTAELNGTRQPVSFRSASRRGARQISESGEGRSPGTGRAEERADRGEVG